VPNLSAMTTQLSVPSSSHKKHGRSSGQHSIGYAVAARHDLNSVVVKQFFEMTYADRERATCAALKGKPNVSRLHEHQPADKLFVAIAPRGIPFDQGAHTMSECHVNQLRAAVEALHATKRVHGDICEQNIYWVSADTALLNDWSHVTASEDPEDRGVDFFDLYGAAGKITGNKRLASRCMNTGEPATKKHRVESKSTPQKKK
jgi:hypothetical protein